MVLLPDLCFRLGGRLSIFVLLRLALLFVCRTGSQQKKNCRHRRALPHNVLHAQFEPGTKLLELHVAVKVTAGQKPDHDLWPWRSLPMMRGAFTSATSSVDALRCHSHQRLAEVLALQHAEERRGRLLRLLRTPIAWTGVGVEILSIS
jgi:hypothetical protein